MSAPDPTSDHVAGSGEVCVRFWAAARAAAGVPELTVEVPGTVGLDALVELVRAQLPGRPQLDRVLSVCSALVEDRPVGPSQRTEVVVAAGATVELLPPFAGG